MRTLETEVNSGLKDFLSGRLLQYGVEQFFMAEICIVFIPLATVELLLAYNATDAITLVVLSRTAGAFE